MKSSPWLLVAVYVRTPAAEAPIATDSAANSDSTLMYSQFAISPAFTISPRPSTMCVCGVIGYAQITCGRHSAIVSATAREPSICLSIDRLPGGDRGAESFGCRRDVLVRDGSGEFLADRGDDRIERDQSGDGRERTEQRHVGHRTADMFDRDLGRRQCEEPVTLHAVHEAPQAKLIGRAR